MSQKVAVVEFSPSLVLSSSLVIRSREDTEGWRGKGSGGQGRR